MVNQGDEAGGNIHVVLHLDSRILRAKRAVADLKVLGSKPCAARLFVCLCVFPVAVKRLRQPIKDANKCVMMLPLSRFGNEPFSRTKTGPQRVQCWFNKHCRHRTVSGMQRGW
jgi:hypothetical protein